MRGLLFAAALLCAPLGARAQIIPNPPAGNGSMTFQAGRFYTANGIITTVGAATFSITQLTTGMPIYISSTITLQTLSAESLGTVTGTAHMRMALYTDAGGLPGVPVPGTDTGDLTQTSSGALTSGILGVALTPGWYWPVWESSGVAGATMQVVSSGRPSMDTQMGSSVLTSVLNTNWRTLLETHTYGTALPSPWVTTTESGGVSMPVIALGF
jgi:hypothetical protein